MMGNPWPSLADASNGAATSTCDPRASGAAAAGSGGAARAGSKHGSGAGAGAGAEIDDADTDDDDTNDGEDKYSGITVRAAVGFFKLVRKRSFLLVPSIT